MQLAKTKEPYILKLYHSHAIKVLVVAALYTVCVGIVFGLIPGPAPENALKSRYIQNVVVLVESTVRPGFVQVEVCPLFVAFLFCNAVFYKTRHGFSTKDPFRIQPCSTTCASCSRRVCCDQPG